MLQMSEIFVYKARKVANIAPIIVIICKFSTFYIVLRK